MHKCPAATQPQPAREHAHQAAPSTPTWLVGGMSMPMRICLRCSSLNRCDTACSCLPLKLHSPWAMPRSSPSVVVGSRFRWVGEQHVHHVLVVVEQCLARHCCCCGCVPGCSCTHTHTPGHEAASPTPTSSQPLTSLLLHVSVAPASRPVGTL